jgi:hypothetical protein
VGGHRFAANLVMLPHGLYYGPVGLDAAAAAIDAYQRGEVLPDRYRGRAGQPRAVQEVEYARLVEGGALPLALAAADFHDREDFNTAESSEPFAIMNAMQ